MTCPHCDNRPHVYLMEGPWELDPDGTNPALYTEDPQGGDPLIVASLKRIHRHEILRQIGLPHKLPPVPDCGDRLKAARSALRKAVAALEMMTDQNAIKSSTVANAFTSCVEAAAIGRRVLADQNPVKSAPEAQDEGER